MNRPDLSAPTAQLLLALAQIRQDADWKDAARPVIEAHLRDLWEAAQRSVEGPPLRPAQLDLLGGLS